jgi:hypothetical protein
VESIFGRKISKFSIFSNNMVYLPQGYQKLLVTNPVNFSQALLPYCHKLAKTPPTAAAAPPPTGQPGVPQKTHTEELA